MVLPEKAPEPLPEVKHSGPGTMLVPVQEEDEAAATPATPLKKLMRNRFALPGLVAAGVLVGVCVGVLMAGGDKEGDAPANVAQTETAPATQAPAEQPAATPVQTQTAQAEPEKPQEPVAPPPEPVAQVYIKLQPGERVQVNGKPQAVVPAANGFAALQLAPGNYTFSVTGQGGEREQTLTINQQGVWLLDPHI